MRVQGFRHVDFEDFGCIAPALAGRGHRLSATRFDAGEMPPGPEAYDALLVMGGPMNIYEDAAYPWLRTEKAAIRAAIGAGRPVLGICLGAQLVADVLGAPTTRNAQTEIGWFDVELAADAAQSWAFAGFPERFRAFHWHGDTFAIPAGARSLMRSDACANQAFALRTPGGAKVAAIQFHLEVTAADARTWFEHETPPPARYVQSPARVLGELDAFAQNNRLMLRLLDNWLAD